MRRLIALFIVAMLPLPVLAQSPTTRPEHHGRNRGTLTVTGNGEVSAKPDRAVVVFGIQSSAKAATSVQNEVNQKIQAVLDSVKSLGVDPSQIQTSTVTLYPVVHSRGSVSVGPADESIDGYRASNMIRVHLTDLSKIGPIIDAGVKAGANRIEGVNFTLKNDTDARNAALAAAAKRAHAKAEILAGALGLQIDGIDAVNEGGAVVGPPRPMMRMAAAEAPTSIEPGQLDISATVTIRYRVSPAK